MWADDDQTGLSISSHVFSSEKLVAMPPSLPPLQSTSSLVVLLVVLVLASGSSPGVLSATFTVTNNCAYTVWPGVLASAGSAPLATTGFALAPSESRTLDAPVPWSGRLWARTICAADPASGRFSCATGDCGSGSLECSGGGAAPPATLAEFTLGGSGGTDFYDVSLVDGSNVPMLVVPQSGSPGGSCGPTGCLVDLNGLCPAELRVAQPGGETAACRSACEAFRTARYCCSGEFGSPGTCGPTAYSQFFKNACPRAYSYAYDDATSTFTCPTAATAGYTVTLCPSTTSLKSMGYGNQMAGGLPLINNTMPPLLSSPNRAARRWPTMSPASRGLLCLAVAVALQLQLLHLP
nr:PREDICTED: thaumatin-like protein 1b isoform X1 [Musa acuminata subsp. malaccensis]XP_018685265.1 PREDICTED: thaumatin-like protein 1b isoform X1 [Musa acuminata subsp. malaccensis]